MMNELLRIRQRIEIEEMEKREENVKTALSPLRRIA